MPVNVDLSSDYANLKEIRAPHGKVIRSVIPYLATNEDPASNDIPFRGKLTITYCLLASWLGVFIASMSVANWEFSPMKVNWMLGPSATVLTKVGGMTHELVFIGNQYWRLLTCEFCHAGLVHLAINAVSLYYIGEVLEPDWGSSKYLTVFMASVLTASTFSCYWSNIETVSVGASGGIYGVMTGLIIYVLEYWGSIPRAQHVMIALSIAIVVCLALSFLPTVDWRAHCGGALGGILASLALMRDLPRTSPETPPLDDGNSVDEVLDTEGTPGAPRKKIRFFRLDYDSAHLNYRDRNYMVIADLPVSGAPAVVKDINPSARRTCMRRDGAGLNPLGWRASVDKWNWSSSLLWSIRLSGAISFLLINIVLVTLSMKQGSIETEAFDDMMHGAGRRLMRMTLNLETGSATLTSA